MKTLLAVASAGIVMMATLLILSGTFMLTSRQAQANPKYAQETGKGCPFCHSAPPALNDNGKKFQANGHKL